jgi:NADH-quinone oxidoreductase subunit N
LLQISGVVTVLLASILVLTAPTFGRLLAYLLLLDIGATVLAFAFGTFAGIEATMSLLVLRTISLIMAGIALGLLRRQFRPQESGSDRFAENVGLAWRAPMSVALFAYGALSLAGLPMTPGFSGRWAVVLLAADDSPLLAAILVLSVAIAFLGMLRCLATLLKKPAVEPRPVPETKTMRTVTGLALVAGLLIALFPQTLLSFARDLAELF